MSAASDAPCLNCGHALAAPGCFCPQCGQAPAHRLSTAHVAHELLHVFTHADKGVLAYVPALLRHPGRLLADYLAGRRKRYFNPFQFLLLSAALATLLLNQLHVYDDLAALQQLPASYAPAQVARAEHFYHVLTHGYNLLTLFFLPFNAAVAWLVYRRQGTNYAEAFFMCVLQASAFTVYSTLLFVGAGLAHQSAAAAGVLLGAAVTLGHFTAFGRTALGLRWPPAVAKALGVTLLILVVNSLLNKAAFLLYMVLG